MSASAIPDPTPNLKTARAAFGRFINSVPPADQVVILHDSDADGVSAGVVLQRALERFGMLHITRIIPDRNRNAWTPAIRSRVEAEEPNALFVLDLGSAAAPILAGLPTCIIDHHQPEGVPPGALLVSAYSWRPVPNTSLMVWDLCSPIVPIEDLDWVAAVGILSDLGDKAPFDLLRDAKSRYTAKYLKEVTTLVNAARRSSGYHPETAARALLTHHSPREIVESLTLDVEALRTYREEVKWELVEAKKAAPHFSGQVALIRITSRCQIHQLIAQIWRSRLPRYVVIVGNEAYLPGRVVFSVRAAEGTNVLDLLRALPAGEGEANFGHGHDAASGGSLPIRRWNNLLDQLGFPSAVHCPYA